MYKNNLPKIMFEAICFLKLKYKNQRSLHKRSNLLQNEISKIKSHLSSCSNIISLSINKLKHQFFWNEESKPSNVNVNKK